MHKDRDILVKAINEHIDDPEVSLPMINELLVEDPNDPVALHFLGYTYMAGEKYAIAYNLFRRLIQIKPESEGVWANLGKCASELHFSDEALKYFMKSIELNPDYAKGYANIASELVKQSKYDEAIEYAETALEMEDNLQAKIHLGFAKLAKEQWAEGWGLFEESLGGMFRKEITYGDETRFNGERNKTVVVYGEQGLGDEIMYSSMIPDAAKDNKIIMDIDPRLAGLFQRSFPDVEVHGTRLKNKLKWLQGKTIDHRCALASLGRFYRRYTKQFTGKPYLKADPEKRVMWRALFDSWGNRPKIGICWSGGTWRTNSKARTISVEDMLPLAEMGDLISLQYKSPDDIEGLPIRHFKATESDDYDDTAALVAELDLVIGIHTSVIHLAGGLGVKTICLVPEKPTWVYANKMPWYESVKLEKKRKGDEWADVINRIIKKEQAKAA